MLRVAVSRVVRRVAGSDVVGELLEVGDGAVQSV